MTEIFGTVYGDAYDLLYHDKDYESECDLIERLLQTHGNGDFRSILDLGCGTGNHALPLARRGYEVVGVDRSGDMLAHARIKAADPEMNGKATFCQEDIRSLRLGRHFDAAVMMFAVLSYQLENSDVLSALRGARRHLRVGGLLVFDVWYGPAVLHQRPGQRVKVIPSPDGQILRTSSGEVDVNRHRCTVQYCVWRVENGRLEAKTEESHAVRYFFTLELHLFLETSGFAPIRLGAFPEFDRDPDETTWNVLGLARAI